MPEDLYDRDILIWSEQQADLLKQLHAADCGRPGAVWSARCPVTLDPLLNDDLPALESGIAAAVAPA